MDISFSDNKISQKINDVKKICYNLQCDDKRIRKEALINLEKYLSNAEDDFTEQELQTIFNETHIYTLKTFRDKTEAVRSQAIKFMSYFIIRKLPKNDYYLTYIFPVFVERIGNIELIEESEEIRLELLRFMMDIIVKYSKTIQLKPFLNDCITVLCETVKDKHPEVKDVSCKCITQLANALPTEFHMQAESLVKPVLTVFGYQRYKIRLEAVRCMGDIVMHSNYKVLEEVVGPMAERLFDQIPAVRQMVVQVASRWLREYRDRYSFFHKLLPLILTGLNDEVTETREKAHHLWEIVGLQFEKENENDLKDQMDYLTKLPKYYPVHLNRPNLGCRSVVQRNVIKIAPALARELNSWQGDIRVRCSQLLCSLALHAEDHLTQHLQDLLPAMYAAARDEDQSVVENVIQGSEYIGFFVPVETWTKLILPAIEDEPNYGQLSVLAALIRGAPETYMKPNLAEICKLLSDDSICQSRKVKFQRELVKCVRALLKNCNQQSLDIGECLFVIIVTVVSIRDNQNADVFDITLLNELKNSFGFLSVAHIFSTYGQKLLKKLNIDPKSWTTVTAERCIFETFLLESGEAFGENLMIVIDILEQSLDCEADAESRLKIFIALSTALNAKDEVFKNANDLNEFLQKLLTNVLVPSLVWHAGLTAEAMRTAAVSCLCSALSPGQKVNLFPDSVAFRPFLEDLTPLLLSLIEDASARSRLLALEALSLLKAIAVKRNCWSVDDLVKIYTEIVKRLDDPTDAIRISAITVLPIIFDKAPEEFTKESYKGHHELLLDTFLTHFDDDDNELQKLISECLLALFDVIPKEIFEEKFNKHKLLLRKRAALEELMKNMNINVY
ncbi:hypothetical protein FQA39_LY03639 [Lamprigera yunnana]|nr:hypothetical protein FQA39_LY03639 [Lamprigera yunnana]